MLIASLGISLFNVVVWLYFLDKYPPVVLGLYINNVRLLLDCLQYFGLWSTRLGDSVLLMLARLFIPLSNGARESRARAARMSSLACLCNVVSAFCTSSNYTLRALLSHP